MSAKPASCTKTISQDLRKRVVDYIEAGHSCRAAARHFKVSESFAIKLMVRWQTQGDIAPCPRARPPGSGKLAPYRVFLRAQVESQPDVTLAELTEVLKKKHGVDVHLSNVARCLSKMGLSYKKNSGRH